MADQTFEQQQIANILSGDQSVVKKFGGENQLKKWYEEMAKGGETATKASQEFGSKLTDLRNKGELFNNLMGRGANVVGGLSDAMTGLNSAFGSGGVQMSHFIDASSKLMGAIGGNNRVTALLRTSFEGVTSKGLAFSDAMAEMYKTFSQVSLASSNLESVLGDTGNASEVMFKAYREGISSVSQATGRSIQMIQTEYSGLYKSSQFIADGFDLQTDAATKTQKTFEAYQKAVQVARSTGLEFSDVSTLMTDLFKTQGIRSTEALESIAMLKKGIEGTTLSMPSAVTILKDMASTFRDVSVSSRDMAAAISFAARQQTILASESKYTYRTSEEAASGVAKALQGVVSAQKDWGESIFYTSLAGGSMEEAMDFMFAQPGEAGYKAPMEQAQMMMQGIGSMFGGDIITREEAKTQGRMGEFMAQNQLIKEAYKLQSPQDAARFAGLMEKAAEGDQTAFEEMQQLQEKGSTALGDILNADEKHFNKLYTSSEVGNVFLNKIAVAAGAMARGVVAPMQSAAVKWMQDKAIPESEKMTATADELKDLAGIKEQVSQQFQGKGTPGKESSKVSPQTPSSSPPILNPPEYAANKLGSSTTKGFADVSEQTLSKAWKDKISSENLKFKSSEEEKQALKKFTNEYISKEKAKQQSTSIGGVSLGYTLGGLQQTEELGKPVMWKGMSADQSSTQALATGLGTLDIDKTTQLNQIGKTAYKTTPSAAVQAKQAQSEVMASAKSVDAAIAGAPTAATPQTPSGVPDAGPQPITIPIQLTMDGKIVAQTTVDYIIKNNALSNTYMPKSAAQGQLNKG